MFHNKKLVVALLIPTIRSGIMVSQLSIFSVNALTPYEVAYDIGCNDAGLSKSERYQPERHTDEFVRSYYEGFYACGGDVSPTEEGFQPQQPFQPFYEQPSQQPTQGGIDWITVCNDLQAALVSSCDVLVNPDNTLTAEGERAVGCIRNGIALAGGGSLLLSLPLPLVITALQILEEPTGCGGIVEWGLIGEVGDLRGIINRLA
jgi:hypothetical protein